MARRRTKHGARTKGRATRRRTYRRDARGRFASGGAARGTKKTPRKATHPARRTPTPAAHNNYRTAARIGARVALAAGLAYSEYRHPRLLALPLLVAARGWNKPPRSHYFKK